VIPWRDKPRLRVRELAEVSGLSVRSIRRKIASGELESYLDGGMRFVPIAAVLELVHEQPTSAPPSSRISREAWAMVREIRREAG
jgi:excisionase family DNA binding protein